MLERAAIATNAARGVFDAVVQIRNKMPPSERASQPGSMPMCDDRKPYGHHDRDFVP